MRTLVFVLPYGPTLRRGRRVGVRPACAALIALLGVAACTSGPKDPSAPCEGPGPLDDGAVSALVDGAAWESTATWVAQGESVQFNGAPADGWNLTLVARTADGGETVKAALDAEAFPVTVTLADDGGGFATVYPTDGASFSSDDGGGTLVITGRAEDVLEACFAFDAGAEDGGAVAVAEGGVRAAPFSR